MIFPSIDPRQIVILNLAKMVDHRYQHSLYKEEAKRYLDFCIQKILKKKSVSEPIDQYVHHYLDRIAYSIKKHSLITQREKELLQLNLLKQTAQLEKFSFQPESLPDQEEKEGVSPPIRGEIKTINTESCRLLSRSDQEKKEKDKQIKALKNTLLFINAEQKEWERKVGEELIRTKEWERKCEEEQNATVKKIHALNQRIDASVQRIEKEPDRLTKEYDSLQEPWEKKVEKSCDQFQRKHSASLKEQEEKITSLLDSYAIKRNQAIEDYKKKKNEQIKVYRSIKNQSQINYEESCRDMESQYDDLIFKPTASLRKNPRIDLADPNVREIDQICNKRQTPSFEIRQLELQEKARAANESEQTKEDYEQKKEKGVNWLENAETRYFQPKIRNIREVFIKNILKELGR